MLARLVGGPALTAISPGTLFLARPTYAARYLSVPSRGTGLSTLERLISALLLHREEEQLFQQTGEPVVYRHVIAIRSAHRPGRAAARQRAGQHDRLRCGHLAHRRRLRRPAHLLPPLSRQRHGPE